MTFESEPSDVETVVRVDAASWRIGTNRANFATIATSCDDGPAVSPCP
jgi:hypothetical protein